MSVTVGNLQSCLPNPSGLKRWLEEYIGGYLAPRAWPSMSTIAFVFLLRIVVTTSPSSGNSTDIYYVSSSFTGICSSVLEKWAMISRNGCSSSRLFEGIRHTFWPKVGDHHWSDCHKIIHLYRTLFCGGHCARAARPCVNVPTLFKKSVNCLPKDIILTDQWYPITFMNQWLAESRSDTKPAQLLSTISAGLALWLYVQRKEL